MTTVLIKGRNPINQHFKGCHFHHMHINGNDTIGVYIPEKLHRENNHCNWVYDQNSLDNINKKALIWLCCQAVIKGDPFNPNAVGTYMQMDRPKKGEKVLIASGKPETKYKLKIFLSTQKIAHPEEHNLRTLEDAVLFSIQEAEKVPVLEKRIKELEEVINADNISKINGGN